MSTRLDLWLVEQGFYGGRDAAKRHIAAGEVQVNGIAVTRPSFSVSEEDSVTCGSPERYVSRGGYKLERALEETGISLSDAVVLDVGASTGGFTDCCLQHGARRVYAVDVGHGQLHRKLREDPAVICLENCDIRSGEMGSKLKETPTFCTVDVSFISLLQVLPAALPLLSGDARLVCLIKPQFEAGRSRIGKNGIVKDPAAHLEVLRNCCAAFSAMNCGLLWLSRSPIRGGEGNIEYLALLEKGASGITPDLKALIKEAFSHL